MQARVVNFVLRTISSTNNIVDEINPAQYLYNFNPVLIVLAVLFGSILYLLQYLPSVCVHNIDLVIFTYCLLWVYAAE